MRSSDPGSSSPEPQSYVGLFRQYRNLVFKTSYLMLGNTQDAEDSMQEIFLRVFRSLSSFTPDKGAFTTWLYRVTVNYCIDQQRKPKLRLSALWDGGHPTSDARLDADTIETERVRAALDHLSSKLRGVVVLRYYANLSYTEIAEALNLPVGTVKSRMALAMEHLSELLADTPQPRPAPVNETEIKHE
jgi:RNA polymerase sigma-70 factor, ECF subfamily